MDSGKWPWQSKNENWEAVTEPILVGLIVVVTTVLLLYIYRERGGLQAVQGTHWQPSLTAKGGTVRRSSRCTSGLSVRQRRVCAACAMHCPALQTCLMLKLKPTHCIGRDCLQAVSTNDLKLTLTLLQAHRGQAQA